MIEISCKDLIARIVKSNDIQLAIKVTSALKRLCKDSAALSRIIPVAGENNVRLSKDPKAKLLEIKIELTHAKQLGGSGALASAAPVQFPKPSTGVTVDDVPAAPHSGHLDTIMRVDLQAIEHMLCRIEAPEGGYIYEQIIKGC